MSYSQKFQGKFGLVIGPGLSKKPGQPAAKPALNVKNVFGGAEDEPESASAAVNLEVMRHQAQAAKQATQHVDDADESLYDYDSFVDRKAEAERARAEASAALAMNQPKRESRYITNLLGQAQTRELERERIYERKLVKERRKEDELYGDKPMFVTEGYKKKLEEQRRREEEDARREALNGDVTKKGDLSGFYRHLLGELAGPDDAAAVIPPKESTPETPASHPASEDVRDVTHDGEKGVASEETEAKPAAAVIVDGIDVAAILEKKRKAEEAVSVTVAAPAGPSKAELIAAAKERAMQRKRARESGGDAGTTTT
jgi:coiled-coil domain-containing protein 55